MYIRKLQEDDFRQVFGMVSRIHDEGIGAIYFTEMPSEGEFAVLFQIKMDNIRRGDQADFVAIAEGRVIGECEIVRIREQGGVIGIIVENGSRDRGIGKGLLLAAIEEAKRMGMLNITAEVAEENVKAVGFFVKMGFVQVVTAVGRGRRIMHMRIA